MLRMISMGPIRMQTNLAHLPSDAVSPGCRYGPNGRNGASGLEAEKHIVRSAGAGRNYSNIHKRW